MYNIRCNIMYVVAKTFACSYINMAQTSQTVNIASELTSRNFLVRRAPCQNPRGREQRAGTAVTDLRTNLLTT